MAGGKGIPDGPVVVRDGYTAPTHRIRLAEAGHPVPDARGEAAALAMLERVKGAGGEEVVLFLVSGGGSGVTVLR